MPCDCGNRELPDPICYECGNEIEKGTEVIVKNNPYHQRCAPHE